MHKYKTSFLLLVLMLFLSFYQLKAQDRIGLSPAKELHQYLIDKWSTENGLPYNNLSHIFQSSDGYLWISTFEGLIRFDGKTFDIFTQKDFDVFKTNGIYQVDEDKEGRLWLGTQGSGLLYYKNGEIINATPNFEKPISAVFCAKNGLIWMGTINSGVFSLMDGKREEVTFEGLKGAAIRKIIEDEQGRVWFASEGHGLFVYDHGNVRKYTVDDGLPNNRVVALAKGESNELWVGTTKGLCKWNGSQFTTIDEFTDTRITDLKLDNYQHLWVGTRKGLARMRSGTELVEWINKEQGLSGNSIAGFTFDKEGSLWLVTRRSGLTRLWDGKFINYTVEMGLRSKNINHICNVGPKEYWIASDNGTIDSWKDDEFTAITLPKELNNARIKHIFKDSQDRIWVASYNGVLKYENGSFEYLNKASGLPELRARKVYEDADGNIWIGFRSAGLVKLTTDGQWQNITTADGLSSNFIMSIEGDKEGNLLVGTNGGGLDIIDKNGQINVYDKKDGLGGTIIFNMYVDKDNNTWLATNAGVARFKNGSFRMFRSSDGLPISTPFDIQEDDNGNFWMPSSDGIFRIEKQSILDYEKGVIKEITFQLYDRGDGLLSKECTPSAKVLKSHNGHLWFPNLSGLAEIDPSNIPTNNLIPEVRIKQMLVDDEKIDIYKEIFLEPGKKRFVIDFTALSFVSPPKMQFKYKLSGMDQDWVNVGEERQAIFTNIPYGTHNFQVIASNNDGVWNNEGATLKITLKPFFYQTPWAYVLGILLFVGLGIVIYKARIRAIKQRNEELESQVLERTAEINSQKEEITSQRDQLSDSFNKIKTVSKIGQEVTQVLSVEELVMVVYNNLNKLMPVDGFGIGLFNPQEHILEFRGYIEKGNVLPNEYDKVSNKNLLSVYCFESKESIFINDIDKDAKKYFNNLEFPNHGEAPKSIIYLPLRLEDRTIGVITVQCFERGRYTVENMNFLQTLANYIAIALDNAKAYEIIHVKNQDITDSLRYAQTIQQAILPTSEQLSNLFSNHFLLFQPKDIVSGDFYWTTLIDDVIYLAVVDCTGHGVPGAFMSMIGIELLNEIVIASKIASPAKILSVLDKLIYRSLNQGETKNTDGMDVGLCRIEKEDNDTFKVFYAGAKRPLFYTESGELKELKGDRKHIGGIFQKVGLAKNFTEYELTLTKGDRLYLTTDGFVDQASPQRKKIGTRRLREILISKQAIAMGGQGGELRKILMNHQQDAIQRDDITILGVEL